MLYWLTVYSAFIALSSGENYHNTTHGRSALCLTPNNQQGICLPMMQCPEMKNIFRKAPRDTKVLQFLLRSRCDFRNWRIICCPRIEYIPDEKKMLRKELMITNDQSMLSPPECGMTSIQQTSRIVGGIPAKLDAWPWIALLGYRREANSDILWFCGGALATEQYIITAAHCLETKHLGLKLVIVRLGENELHSDINDPGKIDVEIKSMIVHPDYSSETRQDDIGLIRLDHPINYTYYVHPICLPQPSEMRNDDFVGTMPFVAGWGTTSEGGPTSDRLLQIQIPVLTNKLCEGIYKPKGGIIINRQLCAGYLEGGKDTCQGDSGGPLMLLKGNFYYIIGVVSYGFGCANAGYPGVYTRLTSYYDWLAKYLSSETEEEYHK